MKTYQVKSPITINGCLLVLNDEQASRRSHCVEPVDKRKNLYRLTAQTCFKAGEVIGIDDVSKALLPKLEEVKTKADAKAE